MPAEFASSAHPSVSLLSVCLLSSLFLCYPDIFIDISNTVLHAPFSCLFLPVNSILLNTVAVVVSQSWQRLWALFLAGGEKKDNKKKKHPSPSKKNLNAEGSFHLVHTAVSSPACESQCCLLSSFPSLCRSFRSQGKPLHYIQDPSLTARHDGVCPVSHSIHLTSPQLDIYSHTDSLFCHHVKRSAPPFPATATGLGLEQL